MQEKKALSSHCSVIVELPSALLLTHAVTVLDGKICQTLLFFSGGRFCSVAPCL